MLNFKLPLPRSIFVHVHVNVLGSSSALPLKTPHKIPNPGPSLFLDCGVQANAVFPFNHVTDQPYKITHIDLNATLKAWRFSVCAFLFFSENITCFLM